MPGFLTTDVVETSASVGNGTQPRSFKRESSAINTPSRDRKRSFSRARRHQRASHSRSLGRTTRASRAQPARKPAAASARA